MRKAFLIGFQYKGERKLPGIATDLYQVSYFLKKHGWEDSEIVIMTDIEKDESTEILKSSILEKIVNSDVLTFIEESKEKQQYIKFISQNHYNNFSSIFVKSNYYFIYYTGHCKNGNIILPDNAYISLDTFKNYFLAEKTFCVMDCCEGGIELPFILHDKIYRCRDELDFVKSEIICISSSLENENSVTSRIGSFFTRHLFSILNDSTISLTSILQKIRKSLTSIKQTATITVSHPTLYNIPGFFYSFPTLAITSHSNFITVIK